MQDIEKRLSRPIPALAADLSLPPEIAARVAGGGGGGATQYGQQRGGGVSQEVMERVQVRTRGGWASGGRGALLHRRGAGNCWHVARLVTSLRCPHASALCRRCVPRCRSWHGWSLRRRAASSCSSASGRQLHDCGCWPAAWSRRFHRSSCVPVCLTRHRVLAHNMRRLEAAHLVEWTVKRGNDAVPVNRLHHDQPARCMAANAAAKCSRLPASTASRCGPGSSQ